MRMAVYPSRGMRFFVFTDSLDGVDALSGSFVIFCARVSEARGLFHSIRS